MKTDHDSDGGERRKRENSISSSSSSTYMDVFLVQVRILKCWGREGACGQGKREKKKRLRWEVGCGNKKGPHRKGPQRRG